MKKNRTFGVEIEWKGDSDERYHLEQKMRNAGMKVSRGFYGHHAPSNFWKIENDNSCGSELISPILKGEDGLAELQKALELLNELNPRVNRDCGVHVHQDAQDFELENFKNLIRFYIKYEQAIDSVMPKSRRKNHNDTYLASLGECRYYEDEIDYKAKYDKVRKATSLDKLRGIFNYDRYYKVNLEAYLEHGTVEFRHHSGSTDFEKISNWVKFTQALMERAKRGVSWRGYKDLDCLLSYDEFREDKEIRKYYRERQEELSIPYSERQSA